MQTRDIRAAILTLRNKGNGVRAIARALGVSRNTVRRVLASGEVEVPVLERAEKAEPHEEQIRALFASCKGNLVRVHEELTRAGMELPYSTLTGFCRRRGLGQAPKERAGQYHFEPGEEMQHDTSPHDVTVGGKLRRVQCASLVLCYSRRIFAMVGGTPRARAAATTSRTFWTAAVAISGHVDVALGIGNLDAACPGALAAGIIGERFQPLDRDSR